MERTFTSVMGRLINSENPFSPLFQRNYKKQKWRYKWAREPVDG